MQRTHQTFGRGPKPQETHGRMILFSLADTGQSHSTAYGTQTAPQHANRPAHPPTTPALAHTYGERSVCHCCPHMAEHTNSLGSAHLSQHMHCQWVQATSQGCTFNCINYRGNASNANAVKCRKQKGLMHNRPSGTPCQAANLNIVE